MDVCRAASSFDGRGIGYGVKCRRLSTVSTSPNFKKTPKLWRRRYHQMIVGDPDALSSAEGETERRQKIGVKLNAAAPFDRQLYCINRSGYGWMVVGDSCCHRVGTEHLVFLPFGERIVPGVPRLAGLRLTFLTSAGGISVRAIFACRFGRAQCV
jgi:hypothetical protein